tara:strand:+ start:3847 stop:6066 length:2220 start_codon:yes stop_codon:yes gene_type:complete
MQKIVLYIKNDEGVFKRVDMFNDESVVLKSQIQDIKDVGKIFTDFSRLFTLPSSKENNKLFKHYYNESIENGFDARNKKEAIIELDFLPFKRGKILLNSVKMKNNMVHSYNIIFYGNTVSLKDLMGEDELNQLAELDDYTHDYTSSNVKSGLQSGLFSGKIVYPLISHTKRFYYDSEESIPNYNGNLYYNTSQNNIGLEFDDLKPAVKCMTIIEAIETKYNISFTRDFFNETSGSPFKNLFLWLSRNKGPVGGDENQEEVLSRICGPWGYSSGDLGFNITGDTWTVSTSGNTRRYDAELTITTTGANQSKPYSVKAIDYVTGNTLSELSLGAGASRAMTLQLISTSELINYQIKWIVESSETLSFTPSLDMTEYILNPNTLNPIGTNTAVFNINGTGDSISTTGEIIITENVPKIKTIDFLTGLFKMFNLTAYYIDDFGDTDYDKIYVDTLDNFYADAVNNPSEGKINITKYIDVSNTDISPSVQFKELEFKYEEPSTLLAINHQETFNEIFGDETYKPQNVNRGEVYKVETGFEHMKFERIIDENKTGTSPYSAVTSPQPYITDILWGYSADGDFESKTDITPATGNYSSVLTKSLVFYAIQETGISSGKGIKWISDGTPAEITQYYRPSNTNEDGSVSTAPDYTINFSDEADEWNLTNYSASGFSNSLFKKFYKTYITDVFNQYKRIYKLKAKFPADFLINYRLNDILVIQDREFTINSISTNLKDGKSDLELLIKL